MQRLFHFSQDPGIKLFIPHVARTSGGKEPFVWAVDEMHTPSYWFPRDCPRVCCWAAGGANRWHALEFDWVERFRDCQLYVYEFDSAPFLSQVPDAGYWVARDTVTPLSVEPVGDLLTRHAQAGVDLRIVKNLWPLIDAVATSGLEFSIIRKANAQPRL